MKNVTLAPSLIKLVNILNDGQYHNGTSMGESLNITRSAVWKALKKLKSYGVGIDAVKGKGYALQEPLSLIDKQFIKNQLISPVLIEVFESITSTNDYLKTFFMSKTPRICLAEKQSKGKGRFDRNWFSPFGKNIYLSCLYPFQLDVSELTGLSLIVSLAITRTLKTYIDPKHLCVKWPNDVLFQAKKLCGNLIELQAESHGNSCAIIGMGINVNLLSSDNPKIATPWISLREITGQCFDRNLLIAELVNHLFSYLKKFEQQGLLSFIEEWKQLDYLVGKCIAIKGLNEKILGTVKGIDENGHLLLKLKNGNIRSFSSGDTQIVKNKLNAPL